MAEFNEGLFACFADCGSCVWATFVPGGTCCMQALASDKATGDGTVIPCLLATFLGCVGSAINRGKIRSRFGIAGSFVADCLIWWYCVPCAACQEYREVQSRVGKS